VKVTILSTYNFLGFLVGHNAAPLKRDISSSSTMRMETNYDPTSGTAFTPTNTMTGLPACPAT
jgi:hypothetical protein